MITKRFLGFMAGNFAFIVVAIYSEMHRADSSAELALFMAAMCFVGMVFD